MKESKEHFMRVSEIMQRDFEVNKKLFWKWVNKIDRKWVSGIMKMKWDECKVSVLESIF